ncbi:MAG: ribosome-associated translation inhibitor RaiA [Pseudomonadota bacterium]
MKTKVTGKQVDVGAALTRHIEEKLTEAVSKHAHRPVEATVTLSREAHLFTCDCSAHLSTGLTAQSSGEGADAYAACDRAINRLEKQLRRYKRRLKDHHKMRKEPVAVFDAPAYVLANPQDEIDEDSVDDSASGDANSFEPLIIAETTETIPTLTVGEAVMQMELKEAQFMLFLDSARGRLNAVYRRKDGNIGWIDPTPASSS